MTRVMPKLQEYLRRTVSETQWPLVNRLWLEHYTKSGILDPYKGLNWFVPTRLGGMGLDHSGFSEPKVTYAQLALASRLALDPDSPIPRMPGAEGSLLTESNKRKLRDLYVTLPMHGELVRDARSGKRMVLDSKSPLAIRNGSLCYRGHVLLDDQISSSSHIDSWLDYHVQGIRIDPDRVRQRVTRALHWGLRLSEKKFLSHQDLVDQTARFRCVVKNTFVPVSNITRT